MNSNEKEVFDSVTEQSIDEQLAEVLFAISVITKRMAIQVYEKIKKDEGRNDE